MGSPPEDDAGAEEGAPEGAVDRPASPVQSGRQSALAARMDAFLAAHSGDDEEEEPARPRRAPTEASEIEVDEIEEVEVDKEASAPVVAPPAIKPPIPPRPVVAIPPPRPSIPAPPRTVPPMRPPAIPPPRASGPLAVPPIVAIPAKPDRAKPASDPPPIPARAKTGENLRVTTGEHPPVPIEHPRTKPPTLPPPPRMKRPTAEQSGSVDDVVGGGTDVLQVDGGVEVGTATPNIVIDQPLEAHLESPTIVDKAIDALGESGAEQRAEAMSKELEAKVLSDPSAAAYVAYELGELYERRLADEARGVKAYGRALDLDPSLRPNLWAIRRVFYKRQLWPNLAKLVDAETNYARDDQERADLLLEKARVCGHRLGDAGEARNALDEAIAIAPQHQGVLLELERVAAKAGDTAALLDVWERLADAVEQPARKIAYWLEVGRAAGTAGEAARAQEAFDKAAQLAGTGPSAERVARERLRVAEEHGTPADVATAIDALATVLLAGFGPAGPSAEAPTDKANALRHELVALRRRQAQLARADQPDKAWELLQQASAMAPGEPIVLADLTELAEELGRYEDLAELVQSWQSVEGDPARAMVLQIRRADALLRGGKHEQARALLASLEAAAPGFIVLTSAAERDALGRKDPHALAKTLLSAAHAALLGTWLGPGHDPQPDRDAAAALYVQAAELLAHEVAGPGSPEAPDLFGEARGALLKALEAVVDYPPAIEALVELDDAAGQVGEALTRLRAVAERAPADAKRPILERAIRVARGHGDLDAVLALEWQLVAMVPDDLPLRWRLESTLAQLGKDEERADLLVQLAADETDATRRGNALLAAARLRERAGGVEAATELYRKALTQWPDDTFARESLIDLLRAQEKWSELVAERRSEARALPDGPAARRALREAAWVLEIRMGDAAQAAAVYDDWALRFPEDRAALEGVARCKIAAGDTAGEVRARAALAEAEASPEARWLYARSLERAGQHDDAAEQYRALLTSDEAQPSVAAIGATLALSDLAAARGDTVMRVEATASLAGRTSDPVLGGALAEDSGWMYALVLEDFDRAAASFEAAITLDPTRRGALLGAALVAARRGDQPALAHAYEGLAAAVAEQMPEASAALLLRGAAMAVAAADLELANQRVTAARTAAPDDTSALLVVAETGTTPHVEASDPFAAVDPLLARAEILEMRGALADDPAAAATWELDRAEALELAGRVKEAGAVVAAVLKTRPDDLRALSALRRMAVRAGDRSTAASAAYSLARVIGDRTARLELLREAAAVFDGPGLAKNLDHAVATLRRICAIEPGAIEHERLLELLRERADTRGLVSAITDKINWLEAEGGAPESVVPLLLERATVLHGLGDTESAMADLDALLDRQTRHVEALRFRADLAFNAGDVETAVALWRRYLAAETRASRRAEIELQLSQVLAENTGDLVGAIENLERVVEANPEDVQLRERLLGLCLRANDYQHAIKELRALARLRPTPQDRAREELRLGLMLRDKLDDRSGARTALERARTLDPVNLDVVRELADLLEPAARIEMLGSTAASMREAIAANPRTVQLYERLAQINAWQADVDARWVALAAVEALSPTAAVDQRQVLVQGRASLQAPTKIKLDEGSRRLLRGELGGPVLELWRAIAPAVQAATGVDAGKLGFARGDKIALKKLGDKLEPVATALAAFGVDDVEIYVSASRSGVARALAGETPILCLGADVAAATTPNHRFLLGRTVATLAEGVAGLADLREGELPWTIAAALRACDVAVPSALSELVSGEENSIAERARVLKKELSRKAKAVIAQVAPRIRDAAEIEAFRTRTLDTRNRAGLLWSGDLAIALAILDVGKGGRQLTDSPTALALVGWSVSLDHLKLRSQLGVALKGTAR